MMSNALNVREWLVNYMSVDVKYIAMRDGCKIAYEHRQINPSFKTVVLAGSLGTTFEMWDPQVEVLSQHFNVVRYDARGHGRSDVFPGAYSTDRLGLDVIDLIDALGLETIYFCGLSIGGMVGQWLSVRHPERIERLVLANTAAFIGAPDFWQQRIESITKEGVASIWEATQARWFTTEFLASETALIEQLESMFKSIDTAGYAACCAAIRDMDSRPFTHLNKLPTLIIAGSEDMATTLGQSEELHEFCENSVLLVLEAGHLSNLECQSEFNHGLLSFFGASD